MRILILSFYTKSVASYAVFADKLIRFYAEKNGYTYRMEHKPETSFFFATWWKIFLLFDYLRDYDYIFVIDADACFYNLEKRIESFIVEDTDLHICEDCQADKINNGTMILKNSEWSFRFLSHLLQQDHMRQTKMFDQETMQVMFDKNILDIKNHSKIYSLFSFNGVAPWHCLAPDQFIIHFMGRSTAEKVWAFMEIYGASTKDKIVIPQKVLNYKG